MTQTQEAAVSANKAEFNPQCSEVKTQHGCIDMKWSSRGRCLQQELLKTCQILRSKLDPNHAGLKWKMQTSYQTIFLILFIQHQTDSLRFRGRKDVD